MGTWSNTDSAKWLKSGKNTGAILSQEVELNYQVEVQDHINAQLQFQERDNLPKCQYGSQNLEFGQVQMGMINWILIS